MGTTLNDEDRAAFEHFGRSILGLPNSWEWIDLWKVSMESARIDREVMGRLKAQVEKVS